jgi:hypothetical protein
MNKKIIFSLIAISLSVFIATDISASTIFSEDFDNFSLDDSTTELSSSDNWIILNSDSLKFIIDDNWYSSFPYSARLLSLSSHFPSKLFDTITSGSFFYTFKLGPDLASSQLVLCSGSCDSHKYLSVTFILNYPEVKITSAYDGSVLTSFPAPSDSVYEIQVDFNLVSSKISVFVNNSLIIDNASLSKHYKFGSFSGINSFSVSFSNYRFPDYSIFVDDIYLTDIGDNPFVVNGSCGSANNSSFSVFPSDNLCSSGVICSGQPYTDGTYYYWTCYGYGSGATSEDCKASVLVSTAQCGYLANTQYSDSSPPSGSNACLSGSVRDMLQLDDDSWLWYCEVSDDDFVPCSTFSDNPIVITPSLPSSPDIACGDILTGQGFANCVSSVFAWLFLPHQDTIDEFFQLSSLMKTKIPFGYVYSFRDEINNLTSNSPSDFSVALTFNGDDQIPVVNSDTFDILGSDFKSTYFRFIRAILWISFGVWVFTLGRKLFLNNRDS